MVYDISFVGNFSDDATLGAGDVVVVLEGLFGRRGIGKVWEAAPLCVFGENITPPALRTKNLVL